MSLFQQEGSQPQQAGLKEISRTRTLEDRNLQKDQSFSIGKHNIRSHITDSETSPNAKSSRARMTSNNQSRNLQGSAVQLGRSRYYQSRYYQQIHQQSFNSVFYNENNPGVIQNKTAQQLMYENTVLQQEINQRDQIIQMYKSGYHPQNYPINDQIIRDINLRLAQKNTLIEQIHRSMMHFNEQVSESKIQLSPTCIHHFQTILKLIETHEHYPLIVTQRFIDTSKSAQKIIIRSHDERVISEWQYKYEQVFSEMNSWREKVIWFESEQNRYLHQIKILKQNLESSQMRFRSELERQIMLIRQQQSKRYQAQINQLREHLNRQKNQTSQNTVYVNQINNLKVQIQNYQTRISNYSVEINNYKQQISNYNLQINNYKQQISKFNGEIGGYKQQIHSLQIQLQNLRNQPQPNIQEYTVQINNYKTQINGYVTEINSLKQRINHLNGQISGLRNQQQSSSGEQNEVIINLKQQMNIYINEISSYKIQITNLQNQLRNQPKDNSQTYRNQIRELQSVIEQYKLQISTLEQQLRNQPKDNSQTYRGQIRQYQSTIQQYKYQISTLQQQLRSQPKDNSQSYRSQIREYQLQISTLQQQLRNQPKDNSETYRTQIREYQSTIREYQLQISTLQQQLRSQPKDNSQTYRSQIRQLQMTIDQYKQQIYELKSSSQSKGYENQLRRQNQKLQQQIMQLNFEINRLNNRIKRMEDEGTYEALEWKIKYEESVSEIRKLKAKLEDNSQSSYNQWEYKYNDLNRKYQNIQSQFQYYKEQYERISRQLSNTKKFDQSQARRELTITIRHQLQKTIRQELSLQIRQELQVRIRNQLQKQLRQSLQLTIRNQLYMQIQEQLTIKIQSQLHKQIREEIQIQYNKTIEEYYYKLEDANKYIQELEQQIQELSQQQNNGDVEEQMRRFQEELEEWKKNLEEAEKYIFELQGQGHQYQNQIRELNEEYEAKQRQLIERINILTADLQQARLETETNSQHYKVKIRTLQMQIERLKELSNNKVDNSQQYLIQIRDLQAQIRRLTEQYKSLKAQNNSLLSEIATYTREIQQFKSRIEKYEIRIREYSEKSSIQISSVKREYEVIILELRRKIQEFEKNDRPVDNGWEQERERIIFEYQEQLKERWGQLNDAEQYIQKFTKQTNSYIMQLEIKIKQLQERETQVKPSPQTNQQWYYLIDQRYKLIRSQLMALGEQTAASMKSESEYWQSYHRRRQEQFRKMQSSINMALGSMSQFQQTIIIRKNQLHRLDLTNLQQILSELHELRRQKSQLKMNDSFVDRFYSTLKQVSTELPQSNGGSILNQTGYSTNSQSRTVQASSYITRK